MFRPKRPQTITTYGVDPLIERNGVAGHFTDNPSAVLDNSREEVMPRYHRDATVDDPWLAPAESETIKALQVHIAAAQRQTFINDTINREVDVRGFCQDANLTSRQTEVICLVAEGWKQREIASWLQISQMAVWKHLHNGRARLAGRLPWVVAINLTEGLSAAYSG